jgi:hypothetical protein
MSTRTKKERRKRKKRRDQQRRKASIREQHVSRPPAPEIDPRPESAAPALPERERTPMDEWWEEFADAGGEQQLQMFRDKLETMQPGDEWYEYLVPEAIFELESGLSKAEYVAFLEELRETHPAVFAESADWHARSLAFFYAAQERWEDLDRAMLNYANGMTEVGQPFFSVMSLIRLAGRAQPAQRLIDAAMSLDAFDGLTPWAINNLIEWAVFARYQECVESGAADATVDAVYRYTLEIGCHESEQVRQNQREFALRLAGKSTPFQRDQFRKDNEETRRRMYLLTADFLRWLDVSRGFDPLVADELRRILIRTIDDMECKPTVLFRGLRRADFEPALARKLGFMSLDRLHAPAVIIAMQHFYDFLAESGLVDSQTSASARSVCRQLWNEQKRVMEDEWQNYRFVEKYLPQSREST